MKRALWMMMVNSVHLLVANGREALARGDLAAAAAAAQERLRAAADDMQALELSFFVHHRRGETAQAADTLKRVLRLEPRADWAYNDLIRLSYGAGHRADAEQLARTALRVNPRNAVAHHLFGTILSELNDLAAGEWHFRRALALGGEQADFLANLALNLLRQGRTEEAEPHFARAAALAPGNMRTLAHWSKLHEVQGNLERAGQLLDQAQAASSAAEVSLLRANYLARAGRTQGALEMIGDSPNLRGDALLERGRLHERSGAHPQAWRDFVEGKRRLAVETGAAAYQAQSVEAFFDRLKRFFVRAHVELLPQTTQRQDTPQPIFVMGFPRSGTTLVEQILSSHSAVRAGGELPFMGDVRRLANLLFPGPEPFPENLARTWTADNRHAAILFRDYYLARAESCGLLQPGKSFFTDKMPFNEIWLPVLRMAFPHARIVRVVRHPLDVCVSMLSNHLTHGFNCGYAIDSVAHHLAAVHDLIEHYRREMRFDELVLKYETFVGDQRAQTQRLLDYLGLPFEDACLRFHESRRYAPTPSYAQVTEKLNDRSIGRHEHYAGHLRPFLAQLQPMMSTYGY